MTATVVKSAYVALPVVQDDDRIIADLHREAAAGPGRFAIMAGEQPFAIPDQFHIEPEEIGIGVKALVQGIALSAAFDPLPHLLPRIHPQAFPPQGQGSAVVVCGGTTRGPGRKARSHAFSPLDRPPRPIEFQQIKAGFRAPKLSFRTIPTPSQADAQWLSSRLSLRYRCGGSAGI